MCSNKVNDEGLGLGYDFKCCSIYLDRWILSWLFEVFLLMIVVWVPHGVPLMSSPKFWEVQRCEHSKREQDTKCYPNRKKHWAVPSKWNMCTHISCTRTHTHLYTHRHWDTMHTPSDTHTHTVLSGSQCCSIIEQPWCNWQHAFWHVTSIHRQRRCRKTSHTPHAASFFLLFLHQHRHLSLPPPFMSLSTVFSPSFPSFFPAYINIALFLFSHSSPLTPPVSLSVCLSMFLCVISSASFPLLGTLLGEAGSPNPLWHPYLNLPCFCSFHPTAPTLSTLRNNSLLLPPTHIPPMNGREESYKVFFRALQVKD